MNWLRKADVLDPHAQQINKTLSNIITFLNQSQIDGKPFHIIVTDELLHSAEGVVEILKTLKNKNVPQ